MQLGCLEYLHQGDVARNMWHNCFASSCSCPRLGFGSGHHRYCIFLFRFFVPISIPMLHSCAGLAWQVTKHTMFPCHCHMEPYHLEVWRGLKGSRCGESKGFGRATRPGPRGHGFGLNGRLRGTTEPLASCGLKFPGTV